MKSNLRAIFLENPVEFRNTVITDNQISLLRSINESVFPYVTTSQLAEMRGSSIQLASVMLSRLYHKGYLKRTERVAKTGGIEYMYSCAIKFK
jgi:predicted transcriptional regulator